MAVARCLGEAASFTGRVVGFGYDALDPGFYLSRYCDAGYMLPYPSAGDEAFLERLKFIQQQEQIDLLIPCLDAELPSMIRLVPELAAMGIRTFLPSADQLRLRNKDRLAELASHAGIDSPETRRVTQADFFYKCQHEGWSYPLVVKGLFYGAAVVANADEAAAAFRQLAAQWGLPILVQRFLKGEEVNLTAVGDGEGNLLGAVMMKKMALTDRGKAWAGVSVNDERLLSSSESLARAIRWRGPLEVEIMRDEKGNYQLIEINPRFPAWIYLSAGVGCNLPEILIGLMSGKALPVFAQVPAGMLFIRYAEEVIVSMLDYEKVVMTGGRTDIDS